MTNHYEVTRTESAIEGSEPRRQHSQPELAINKREAAQYITEMLLELVHLAKSAGEKTLAGTIELAFYEAFPIANRKPVPPQEVQ